MDNTHVLRTTSQLSNPPKLRKIETNIIYILQLPPILDATNLFVVEFLYTSYIPNTTPRQLFKRSIIHNKNKKKYKIYKKKRENI